MALPRPQILKFPAGACLPSPLPPKKWLVCIHCTSEKFLASPLTPFRFHLANQIQELLEADLWVQTFNFTALNAPFPSPQFLQFDWSVEMKATRKLAKEMKNFLSKTNSLLTVPFYTLVFLKLQGKQKLVWEIKGSRNLDSTKEGCLLEKGLTLEDFVR